MAHLDRVPSLLKSRVAACGLPGLSTKDRHHVMQSSAHAKTRHLQPLQPGDSRKRTALLVACGSVHPARRRESDFAHCSQGWLASADGTPCREDSPIGKNAGSREGRAQPRLANTRPDARCPAEPPGSTTPTRGFHICGRHRRPAPIVPWQRRFHVGATQRACRLPPGDLPPLQFHESDARRSPSPPRHSHPFTHNTCLSVYTTSTRSFCASITASMSL